MTTTVTFPSLNVMRHLATAAQAGRNVDGVDPDLVLVGTECLQAATRDAPKKRRKPPARPE